MTDQGFIILHGLGGSPPGHWQHWLAQELEHRGHLVHFPRLPKPDNPNFAYWMGLLHLDLALLPVRKKILIAHSLGALIWLYYADQKKTIKVDRALIVAPPDANFVRASNRITGFPEDFQPANARLPARECLLVYTLGDPCCPQGARHCFGNRENLQEHVLPPEAGHINRESGFGPWPFALEWALATKSTAVTDNFIPLPVHQESATSPSARFA